jgi:hypothetical protein
MRRSYVVPMRRVVIYEYELPGGAWLLNSTKLPRPWSPWGSTPSRKNPHGRTGNRTRDLMISSQKLWPLDHEAGLRTGSNVPDSPPLYSAYFTTASTKKRTDESYVLCLLTNQQMHIYMYVQSHVITFDQHVSLTPVTIIKVPYKKQSVYCLL